MIIESLKGKRGLITGATRGLGLAIAKEFVRQGMKQIAITYEKNKRDADNAQKILTDLGATPLIFQGSVSDNEHVKSTIKTLTTEWGGLDILVNNAGIMQILPLALIEEKDWDLVMNVNVKGTFLFSQAVLRTMIKAKAGAILNIGTFSSERVIESPPHYAASKSALRGLTESMAKEVGKYNIRVNLLAPGALNEGIGRMMPAHRLQDYINNSSLKRDGTVEETAKMAAFLVSDQASFVTGTKLVLDGGV